MPEVEEITGNIKDLRIWKEGIIERFPDERFLVFKRVSTGMPRVMVCRVDGEVLGSGNLFGFGSDGRLEIYSSISSSVAELGIKLDDHQRVKLHMR